MDLSDISPRFLSLQNPGKIGLLEQAVQETYFSLTPHVPDSKLDYIYLASLSILVYCL